MTTPKKTHGGARAGSGRRKLGRVTVVLTLRPETRERLKSAAKERATTRSNVADQVLSEALK